MGYGEYGGGSDAQSSVRQTLPMHRAVRVAAYSSAAMTSAGHHVVASHTSASRRRATRKTYISSAATTCFFFFQAEDGIRDVAVTGVQTCALPIWRMPAWGFSMARLPA